MEPAWIEPDAFFSRNPWFTYVNTDLEAAQECLFAPHRARLCDKPRRFTSKRTGTCQCFNQTAPLSSTEQNDDDGICTAHWSPHVTGHSNHTRQILFPGRRAKVFRIFCLFSVLIFIAKHPSHHATSAALDAFAWWHTSRQCNCAWMTKSQSCRRCTASPDR